VGFGRWIVDSLFMSFCYALWELIIRPYYLRWLAACGQTPNFGNLMVGFFIFVVFLSGVMSRITIWSVKRRREEEVG